MATVLDSIAESVRQTIDQGIAESLPKQDKFFLNVVRSSMGVKRDNIGRDWKVRHTYSGSISGSHAWRAGTGGTLTLDGSNTGDGFTIYGTGETWQGVKEMAAPGIIQRTITLRQGFGNFPVHLNVLRTDRLDASVGSIVAELVRGASKRQSLSAIHAFWKQTAQTGAADGGNTKSIIGKIGVAAGTITLTGKATGREVTLTSGRIRSFFPGLLVDVYDQIETDKIDAGAVAVGNAKINADGQPLAVVDVDYLAGKFTLANTVSAVTDISSATSGSSLFVVPYASSDATNSNLTNTPEGLEDWIKSSGTLFDGTINLADYSQFRSIVSTGNSGALMSDDLNKHCGGFMDAYGVELDTIVCPVGVLLGFLENLDSTSQLIRYDNQAKALAVKAGFQDFGYQYDGMTYNVQTSPNCPTGTVYVLKLGEKNFKKYVPPRLPKARSDGRFAGEVEFVAPLMGSSNIFLPLLTNSGQVTNLLQAPYENWCQFAPRDVQSIKMTSFDENVYTG